MNLVDKRLDKATAPRLLWVKSYRPIEPIAPPDVGCCSKIGRGFASLRNVAKGQNRKSSALFNHFVGEQLH
jgi:hypothetical protein